MQHLQNQHRGANRRRVKAHVYKHPPPVANALKFIDCRGGFVKYHPPPMNSNQGTTLYIGNSGVAISRLKAFTFRHPPPCPGNQGYQNRQNIYGTKERRPRSLGSTPRGVPCPGLDPEKLAGGTGHLQDLRQPDMEWIRPARAEDTSPSGRTWI